MTPELRQLIEDLRADLLADRDNTVSWGDIYGGVPAGTVSGDVPPGVQELLEVAGGLAAGAFYLPGIASQASLQGLVDGMPEYTGILAEQEQWYLLAMLHDEPVVMRRDTGAVWYFPEISTDEWFMREAFQEIAPDLDSFLAYYVFGVGYREIGSDHDQWWSFLTTQELT